MSRKTHLYRLASPSIRERNQDMRFSEHVAQQLAGRTAHITALLTQVVLSLSEDGRMFIPADELRPAHVDDTLSVEVSPSGDLILQVNRSGNPSTNRE